MPDYSNGDFGQPVDPRRGRSLRLDQQGAMPVAGQEMRRHLLRAGFATGLGGLQDVDLDTDAPEEDQALIWDGTKWVPGSGGSSPSGSITSSGYTMTGLRILGREPTSPAQDVIQELQVTNGLQITGGALGFITGVKGDVTISSDASTLTVSQATLAAVRDLTPSEDQMPYWTGATTAANTSLTEFARSLLDDADAATARGTLSAQTADGNLDALAAVTIAADQLIYGSSDSTWATATLTSFGRTLLDDNSASQARSTLGLGTVSTLSSIANSDMATMSSNTIKGAVTSGSPVDLTTTQVQAITKMKLRCPFHSDGQGACQLGAHPSTDQFLKNLNINMQLADLSTMSQVRIFLRVYTNSASANSPRLIVRYSTTYTTTVGSFLDIGTSEVSASMSSYTLANSGWVDLAAGAKIDDCYIAVIQTGGDSSATPRVSSLFVEFR